MYFCSARRISFSTKTTKGGITMVKSVTFVLGLVVLSSSAFAETGYKCRAIAASPNNQRGASAYTPWTYGITKEAAQKAALSSCGSSGDACSIASCKEAEMPAKKAQETWSCLAMGLSQRKQGAVDMYISASGIDQDAAADAAEARCSAIAGSCKIISCTSI